MPLARMLALCLRPLARTAGARRSLDRLVDELRAQRRHRVAELDDRVPDGLPAPQEDLFSLRERWELLRKSLVSLNPKHRLAVVLRYFEGMPVREIAAVLECSEGVAKNILFRSLKKMRDQLAASAEISS